MSRASSRSEPAWSAGPASTRGRYSTVLPMLPSAWLIRWASAWTSAGCVSPAMTRLLPRLAFRSRATASIQPAWPSEPVREPPIVWPDRLADPERRRRWPARRRPRRAPASASRWSAAAPVSVGVHSTTYSRFIEAAA